jgi:hypothetical protein
VPENSGCNGSDDSLAYTLPSPIMPDSGISEKLKNLTTREIYCSSQLNGWFAATTGGKVTRKIATAKSGCIFYLM